MSDDRLTHDEWTTALRDGDLLGQRCRECGHATAAPKAACARCGARALETASLPTEGTVYSVTTIGVAPEGFDDAPYRVALIDLEGSDARVLGRLAGDCDADIGDRVRLVGPFEATDEDGDPAPLFAS